MNILSKLLAVLTGQPYQKPAKNETVERLRKLAEQGKILKKLSEQGMSVSSDQVLELVKQARAAYKEGTGNEPPPLPEALLNHLRDQGAPEELLEALSNPNSEVNGFTVKVDTKEKAPDVIASEMFSDLALKTLKNSDTFGPDDIIIGLTNAVCNVFIQAINPPKAEEMKEQVVRDFGEALNVALSKVKRAVELGMPDIATVVKELQFAHQSGKSDKECRDQLAAAIKKRNDVLRIIMDEDEVFVKEPDGTGKVRKKGDNVIQWTKNPTVNGNGNA